MALGQVLLGLFGIVLGANTAINGARRVANARPKKRPMEIRAGGRVTRLRRVKSLDERVKHIRQRARRDSLHPDVIVWTRRALSQKCGPNWCVPEKDTLAEVRALYDAIRANVRYTSDVRGVDTYMRPRHTLAARAGDCDDYSSLACAALLSVGIPCKLKVIRTRGNSTWNHIYALAGVPKHAPTRWIPFDASVPKQAGWEAPKQMIVAERVFPVG